MPVSDLIKHSMQDSDRKKHSISFIKNPKTSSVSPVKDHDRQMIGNKKIITLSSTKNLQ
jgi:hypothetical protein